MNAVRYSVIVPAYNEEAYIPRLVHTIDAARQQYFDGPQAIEIIVADNNSTDQTAHVAKALGCRVTHVDKRCIAAARNGGAALAHGDIFCFVDADMRIHPGTFNVIDHSLATGKVVAGATGVRLERMSLGIALTYAVMVPMVWVMKMDTGVVFCRREDFDTIGGYDESLHAAEDVKFLLDLRKLGRRRKQKLARATTAKALSSTRKWDEHGDWHYFRLFAAFFLMPFSKNAWEKFTNTYWYGKQREPENVSK